MKCQMTATHINYIEITWMNNNNNNTNTYVSNSLIFFSIILY